MAPRMDGEVLAGWISDFIGGLVASSPHNSLRDGPGERAFDQPLVGFASGQDPIFLECKRHIGDFFWTPAEAYAQAYPQEPAPAEEVSVISWILPQTQATKDENAREKVFCSGRWAGVRLFGEKFNALLRQELAQALCQEGLPALAPMLLPSWRRETSADYGYASTWSERHAAHAAGLGTFGLCDGLITPLGKAMRTGSVVVRAKLPATPRPYHDHHAYCLFYTHGTCGKCIPRCPVKALSDQGHDKIKCGRHVGQVGKEHNLEHYGLDIEGCGLCQVAVPCASHIPAPEEGL
ncbi:MAG: epoxyqueuosine reductase [Pseudomonadota bacterium]